MRKISTFILKKLGWTIKGNTDYPDKCILCVAPHTSNWDLLIGKLVYWSLDKKASFLIKKTWFFFPMNIILNAIGGIPVDRSRKTSLTDQMAYLFKTKDKFQLAITPEGTRKANSEWKRGFYYIALESKVPIVIVVLDYKKKEVNFRKVFHPTEDADRDMKKIQSYYRGATAKHPERFALPPHEPDES